MNFKLRIELHVMYLRICTLMMKGVFEYIIRISNKVVWVTTKEISEYFVRASCCSLNSGRHYLCMFWFDTHIFTRIDLERMEFARMHSL